MVNLTRELDFFLSGQFFGDQELAILLVGILVFFTKGARHWMISPGSNLN
jgi:hypothetical protein